MAFQEETCYYCTIRKYAVKLRALNSDSRQIDNNKTINCASECFSKNFSCAFWFDLVHSRNITSLNSSSARGRNEKLAFETFVSKATYAGTMETAPKFLFVKPSAIMSLCTRFTNPTRHRQELNTPCDVKITNIVFLGITNIALLVFNKLTEWGWTEFWTIT